MAINPFGPPEEWQRWQQQKAEDAGKAAKAKEESAPGIRSYETPEEEQPAEQPTEEAQEEPASPEVSEKQARMEAARAKAQQKRDAERKIREERREQQRFQTTEGPRKGSRVLRKQADIQAKDEADQRKRAQDFADYQSEQGKKYRKFHEDSKKTEATTKKVEAEITQAAASQKPEDITKPVAQAKDEKEQKQTAPDSTSVSSEKIKPAGQPAGTRKSETPTGTRKSETSEEQIERTRSEAGDYSRDRPTDEKPRPAPSGQEDKPFFPERKQEEKPAKGPPPPSQQQPDKSQQTGQASLGPVLTQLATAMRDMATKLEKVAENTNTMTKLLESIKDKIGGWGQ